MVATPPRLASALAARPSSPITTATLWLSSKRSVAESRRRCVQSRLPRARSAAARAIVGAAVPPGASIASSQLRALSSVSDLVHQYSQRSAAMPSPCSTSWPRTRRGRRARCRARRRGSPARTVGRDPSVLRPTRGRRRRSRRRGLSSVRRGSRRVVTACKRRQQLAAPVGSVFCLELVERRIGHHVSIRLLPATHVDRPEPLSSSSCAGESSAAPHASC